MGDKMAGYEYKYGTDGLGMPSITKKFGVKQDGTFGEITTNQFDGTTDEFSQSNAVSSELKSPSVDSTLDKKELGLFDMNDRGLTRFGSYLDTAATGVGIATGLGSLWLQNKASKIDERNQELAEKKASREIKNQDEAKARAQTFAKNAGGTY